MEQSPHVVKETRSLAYEQLRESEKAEGGGRNWSGALWHLSHVEHVKK
jgi:hypothetical protein